METENVHTGKVVQNPLEEWGREEFFADILECGVSENQEYQRMEEECGRQGLSRWELWQGLAQCLQPEGSQEKGLRGISLGGAEQEKMRKRIVNLIGLLPQKSLGEFRGLVKLLDGFLQRTEFVCDMMVYLFAEREKGPQEEDEEVLPRRYTGFFTEKLMWELYKIQDLGERGFSLAEVEEQYQHWLMDLYLAGEVLV
jgi:hypothetical protein